MKKFIYMAFLMGGLIAPLRAENYLIPQDNNGSIPLDVSLLGTDVIVATGVTAVGSTSPVVLYGYSVSADSFSNCALLRDTNTLNTATNIKLTLYQKSECFSTTNTMTCHSILPVPVIFRNGLSINLQNQAFATSNNTAPKSRWMFYFRYMREGGVPDKTPTQVDPRISVDNIPVN